VRERLRLIEEVNRSIREAEECRAMLAVAKRKQAGMLFDAICILNDELLEHTVLLLIHAIFRSKSN